MKPTVILHGSLTMPPNDSNLNPPVSTYIGDTKQYRYGPERIKKSFNLILVKCG
jgi:hypothetical protein